MGGDRFSKMSEHSVLTFFQMKMLTFCKEKKKTNLDFSLILNTDSSAVKLNKIIHFMSSILHLSSKLILFLGFV